MSKSSKDTLYQVESVEEDFEFCDRVVEVFDDMLDRIPLPGHPKTEKERRGKLLKLP